MEPTEKKKIDRKKIDSIAVKAGAFIAGVGIGCIVKGCLTKSSNHKAYVHGIATATKWIVSDVNNNRNEYIDHLLNGDRLNWKCDWDKF